MSQNPDQPPPPPDALMFRLSRASRGAPEFKVVPVEAIAYWRWFDGWILLVSERDIRQADIEDVRRSDEER